MSPHALSTPPAVRAPRADGQSTRQSIVEAAGQLFAERGYAETTSKEICARARTNIAAVNYHFGGRDGLYLHLLREVHQHMMGREALAQLAQADLPAEEKLSRFLAALVHAIIDDLGWHTRLWAREVLTPSPLLNQILREESLPKFQSLSQILAELTGLPPGDPALTRCVLSVVAPCLLLLVVGREVETPVRSLYAQPAAALHAHLLRFALAGLAAVGVKQGKSAAENSG
jgi:TetR/AcrR family transcriptional regulator, regulator of cefoperazone and chloramphenicol sensitivity